MLCFCVSFFFFFKQKTAYEMRISDWSSDVCSSDLPHLFSARNGSRKNDVDGMRVGSANRNHCAHAARSFGGAAASRCKGDSSIVMSLVGSVLQARRMPAASSASLTKIGRAHVCTPVTNAHLVCRLLLEKQNKHTDESSST